MLKSILVTSLRNIIRNKAFSIINLVGLSVSMSLTMLIITIVKESYTFDNFHKDVERIYRVNTMALCVEGGREPYASTPLPLARALKEDFGFAAIYQWNYVDRLAGIADDRLADPESRGVQPGKGVKV